VSWKNKGCLKGDADLIAAETFPQREKSEKRAIMAFNQRFLSRMIMPRHAISLAGIPGDTASAPLRRCPE
jgi:hypothetical protein